MCVCVVCGERERVTVCVVVVGVCERERERVTVCGV